MIKPRPKKFVRSEAADPFRIQPRDTALLRTVADFRFANSSQLLALHEGSERGILNRLSLLYHHGYLERPKAQEAAKLSTGHIVYSLGRKGAQIVYEDAEEREEKMRRVLENEKTSPLIAHSLMISQLHTCLTLALRKREEARIVRWMQGRELKDAITVRRGESSPLVPDAFFAVHDGDANLYYFLEADRGTMTADRFVKKLKIYWGWKDNEKIKDALRIPHFRVLTITPTERRSESLRIASKEANTDRQGSRMFLFAPETRYDTTTLEDVLRHIWKSPKDDTMYSILDD